MVHLRKQADMPDRTCPKCGDAFAPATSRQKFCSSKCQHNFNRDRPGKPPCALCNRPARARGLCNHHYNESRYTPEQRNAMRRKSETPESRRAALRTKTQVRRARLRDPAADAIDRDDIGERDGWRCGLCGRKVDQRPMYPHPSSASLDHIEPLSTGGRHTAANVQIAHLRCNVAKGNRGGGEQLLLIG